MTALLTLSVALFAGLMLSRVVKLIKLPAVTGYLIAGILVGPYALGAFNVKGLGFVSMSDIETYSIIADVALGFIAFSIGNEFRLSDLKKIGKAATIIGILQAVAATVLVDASLIGVHLLFPKVLPLPAAIILGAVASATAPAATLMVVKQYKAKGPLTDLLLPIVALDDAVGLVLFAVSFGVAKAVLEGKLDVISVVLEPLLEVVCSLLLGALMGLLFTFFEKFFHSRSKRMAMSVTFLLLTVAVSMLNNIHVLGVHIAFSPLLVCMMMGTIFCNICDFSEELMDRIDRWSAPILILFFVISGAELELSVFTQALTVIIGIIYIISRSLGKYFGAFLSAKAVKCPPKVVTYLGVTLLPQAGVALGMADKAKDLGEVGAIVFNITLFSVLIYELVGPYFTKVALTRAGEIVPEGKVSAREEHLKKKQKKA